jgi:hypothetical protein
MGSVTLDLGAGTATVAGVTVPVASCPDGAVLVGDVQVRPLTFGERTRAALACATSSDPAAALVATIHAIATTPPSDPRRPAGSAEVAVAQVVALVLAGADEDGEALDFAETVLLVARATGWSPSQLDAMSAVEVDALARSLMPPEQDGWTRLRLAPESVEQVRAGLSAGLLARALPRVISPRVARALHPVASAATAAPTSTESADARTAHAEPAPRPADAAPTADGAGRPRHGERHRGGGPATAPPEGDLARARSAPVPHPTPLPAQAALPAQTAQAAWSVPTTAGTEEAGGAPVTAPATTSLPTTTLRTAGGTPFGHLTGLDERSGHGSTRRAGQYVTGDPSGPAEVDPDGRSGRLGRLGAVLPGRAGGPTVGVLRWSVRADLSAPPPHAHGGPPAAPAATAPAAVSAAPTPVTAVPVTAVPGAGTPSWARPSPTHGEDVTRPARRSAPADQAVIPGSWSRPGSEAPPAGDDAWDRDEPGRPERQWSGVDGHGDVMAERAEAGEAAVGLARLLQEEADLRGMAP